MTPETVYQLFCKKLIMTVTRLDYDKISYHIIYHIVDCKRQNRLKAGRDKPKLKVKMQ